jgi:ACS family tartrate transporter-like MFS transporter
VVLGVVTLFVLDDRPRGARWLAPAERDWLTAELDAEARAKRAAGNATFRQALGTRNVWVLALGIFATNTGGYALTFWLPTAIKGISGGSNAHALWWTGAVYACGILGVYLSGQSSDRTGDRKWHCVAGQCATAALLGASAIPGQPVWLVMIWLCLTGLAAYSWPSPFWALPTMTLTASVAAASIGLINMFANVAGYLGNYNIGALKAHGVGERGCLLLLAGCYLVGGALVSLVRVQRPTEGSS